MTTSSAPKAAPAMTVAAVRTRTFVQAINEALDLLLASDPRVFLLGEDIGRMGGDFGATRGQSDKYGGERVRDTPLSDAAIIGTSAGAAMVGMRPVPELMFDDFLAACCAQMVSDAAR